jgi:hypothetical protein
MERHTQDVHLPASFAVTVRRNALQAATGDDQSGDWSEKAGIDSRLEKRRLVRLFHRSAVVL